MKHPLNRILFLAFMALLSLPAATAQGDDMQPPSAERMKEIKAQKSAYITTQLGLTPEEAQRFWPIYNEMDEKQEVLRRELRELHKGAKSKDATLTEADAAQMLDKGLVIRQKEIDLEKSYVERFKKSIGAVKTVQLKQAERDFNKEVLRKYRDRMDERRGPGGPPPEGR